MRRIWAMMPLTRVWKINLIDKVSSNSKQRWCLFWELKGCGWFTHGLMLFVFV